MTHPDPDHEKRPANVRLMMACQDGRFRKVKATLERSPDKTLVATTRKRGSYVVEGPPHAWVRPLPFHPSLAPAWVAREGYPHVSSMDGSPTKLDAHSLKAAVRSRIIREIWEAYVPIDKLQRLLVVSLALLACSLVVAVVGTWLQWQSLELLRAHISSGVTFAPEVGP